MLIEICIGDSYGAEFEFAEEKYVEKYNRGLGYFPDPKGKYTDDTQQSLAIAEALLEDDPWTPESLAERFVQVFKRDPRFGYSKRLFQLLTTVSSGVELLEKLEPTRDSCGCVMRSVPLGLIKDEEELLEKTTIQAKITHTPEIAIAASKAIALISHYFIYHNIRPLELREMLNEKIPEIDWSGWDGKVLNKAEHVARATLQVLETSVTFRDILRRSVAFTGDVDSVAAVAMGCASVSKGRYSDEYNPKLLILENGEFGGDYIIELDKKLELKFGAVISGQFPLTET